MEQKDKLTGLDPMRAWNYVLGGRHTIPTAFVNGDYELEYTLNGKYYIEGKERPVNGKNTSIVFGSWLNESLDFWSKVDYYLSEERIIDLELLGVTRVNDPISLYNVMSFCPPNPILRVQTYERAKNFLGKSLDMDIA